MESRIIENAEEKLSIEPMVLDLFMEGKLKAKGHFTTGTPCEIIVGVGVGEPNVKTSGYILISEQKNKLVFDLCNPSEFTQELINKGFADMFPSKCDKLIIEKAAADGYDWKFKVIEIVDENNTANIKVNDIIKLSEKMKSRTAGGSFFSKEDKLIATVEENVGLRIIESIKID